VAIQTIRIDVLGTSFTIQTDESREYIDEIVSYLKKKIEAVRKSAHVEDPLKVSILASVYLIDELFRERGQSLPDAEEIDRITRSLIRRIDAELGDGTAGPGNED
jgi:cell division protein ZapA (FtsZ GTPase activity inhibitor)